MVKLYAARHRLPVPALARWLLALGIIATLAANMAQGWSHGPVGAVIAAWPAVSLVGSYERKSMSLHRGSPGSYRRPASSASRMPVARNTAMIAVSRRWVKVRPVHACSSRVSSSPVKTGTSLQVSAGDCSLAIGSGSSSSAASHLKNCCRARY